MVVPGILQSISPVIFGALFLLLGNGLLTTLLGLRIGLAGLSPQFGGLVAASYFLGLTLGPLVVPRLVQRVGHIRCFAALAALAAATALHYALIPNPFVWCLLRVVGGFCFAGLFIVMESWLNVTATNQTRGKILATYMVTNYIALGSGQFLLNLYDPMGFQLFSLVAMLMALAVVPVSLTRVAAPTIAEPSFLRLRELYRISPIGVVGCLAAGMMLSAFYGLTPIFAQQAGLGIKQVSLLMGLTILGGLALQWPVGWLSDRFDRRLVLTVACTAAAGASAVMAAVGGDAPELLFGLGIVFGGVAFTLYPICVTHTNDYLSERDVVAASGGMLIAYGIGAIFGPVLASGAMAAVGDFALFAYMAMVGVALALFTLYRMRRRAPVPEEAKTDFVALPRMSPIAYELDPRAEPDQSELDLEMPETPDTHPEDPV
jgi:MFS family permease